LNWVGRQDDWTLGHSAIGGASQLFRRSGPTRAHERAVPGLQATEVTSGTAARSGEMRPSKAVKTPPSQVNMGLSSGRWAGLGEATASGMARLHRNSPTSGRGERKEQRPNHRGQGRGRSLPQPLLWSRWASKENITIGGVRRRRDVTSSRGTGIPPSLRLGPARWDKRLGSRGEEGGGGAAGEVVAGAGVAAGEGLGGGGTPPGRGLERGAILQISLVKEFLNCFFGSIDLWMNQIHAYFLFYC
jgi:hypothetical protein